MRFITGLILGSVLGLVLALILLPSRGEEPRRRRGILADEEVGAEKAADPAAQMLKAIQALRDQIRQAWDEAQQAAREAEEDMRTRYQESRRLPAAASPAGPRRRVPGRR